MNDAGFEDWYRLEHPGVANGLYLICGSVDIACDATDEAFTRAAAHWSTRCYCSPGLIAFACFNGYCWTRSTIGMMAGGCANSMPSSSMTGPR